MFDHAQDGFAERSGWVTADDGILVRDLDNDGLIESGRELFGSETLLANGTNATNGFNALAELDSNGDQVINAQDSAFSELKVWRDLNSDGFSDTGELLTLQEAGVSGINLSYTNSTQVDAQNNAHKQVGSFTTTNGATRAAVDVWFEANQTESVATSWVAVPEDIALLPNAQGYGKVRDLHQAMAMDTTGQLKALVTSFTQASTVEERNALVTNIIYRWTGVQDVDPASRAATRIYGNAIGDARKLEALEEFMGEEWVGTWCWGEHDPNPHGPAAKILLEAFNQFSELVYSELASQSFLRALYAKITYLWDSERQTVVGDLQGVATEITNAVTTNRSAGKALLAEFVRSLEGMGNKEHVDMAGLAQLLTPLGGDVLSIIDKSISVNATENADNLYGTNLADVVNGLGGNDQIRGLGDADTLDGGNGNDTLYGNGGNDILSGGRGDDHIYGEADLDSYYFGRGDGKDTIYEDFQQDSIITLGDLSIEELAFSRSGANLVVAFSTSASDSITLSEFFKNGEPQGNVILRQANGTERILDAATLIQLTLVATQNADVLSGSSQADTINGLGGDDLIFARAGNDVVDGGAGKDHLNGAEGNDDLFGGLDNDVLYGESGTDTLHGGADHDRLYGGVNNDSLYGDAGDDVLDGEAGADLLVGGSGNDTYAVDDTGDVTSELAGEGTDLINATVSVTLAPNIENATLTGEADINATGHGEANIITGNSGANVLSGLAGNDALSGDAGNDQLLGGDGFDQLYGGEGLDTLDGGAQDDRLYGDADNDRLSGGSGSDLLEGGAGADTLWGDSGSDLLDGGLGADSMAGGQGDDAYIVDDEGDVITEQATEGLDTVTTSMSISLSAHVENVLLVGVDAVSATGNTEANEMVGNQAANVLKGLEGYDNLCGENGDDTLEGGAGNDTLDGGAGIDVLQGGSGDDVFHVDRSNDVILELASEGTDTVYTLADYTLSAQVEHLVLDAVGGYINGTGNALNNNLTGNDFDNLLDGGAGADVLEGLGGNDTYVVDTLTDEIIETETGGTDTVTTELSYTLSDVLENIELLGDTDASATGNAGDNDLRGNTGHNRLDGGLGADQMSGGLGNDTYLADEQGDHIVEEFGEGIDTIERSFDTLYILQDNVENLTLQGTVYRGNGNELDNVLTGNDAANNLLGLDGNDTLIGGAGEDALFGSEGADLLIGGRDGDYYEIDSLSDRIVELSNEGDDFVRSTVSWTLGAHLERLAIDGADNLTITGNTLDNGLWGNGGNNVITGGKGDDYLDGGTGDDTYVFTKGDGQDSIDTTDVTGAVDTLRMAALDTEVLAFRSGSSLFFKIKNSTDQIGIINHYASAFSQDGQTYDQKIDRIEFSNGVVWNQAMIQTMVDRATNNRAPSVSGSVPALSAWQGTSFTYVVPVGTVTDPDAWDSITYSAKMANGMDLPAWLSFDTTSRTLSGVTPVTAGLGALQFVLWGTDNYGSAAGTYVNLTVKAPNTINGTAVANTLSGGSGNDAIYGLGGGDQLYGYANNDRLDGGAGTDTLYGGLGDDVYVADETSDQVIENNGEGNDLVLSSANFTLSAHVEKLTLTGQAAIYATGNDLINTLTGNDAANVIDGGTSADTMIGGLGGDTYVVDNAGDVIKEQGSDIDLVMSSINYTLGDGLESLTLTGTTNLLATGNDLNNYLTGNVGANTINAGLGEDTMAGGAGNDTYVIDSALDQIIELTNQGTDSVQVNFDTGPDGYTLSNTVENARLMVGTNGLLIGNSTRNTLNGGAGNDVLYGYAGADYLLGNAGNDTLWGGGSTDKLIGGAGSDTYVYYTEDGWDFINNLHSNASDRDVLLMDDPTESQVWFARSGDDLEISVIGTFGYVGIENWFLDSMWQLDSIKVVSSGKVLTADKVSTLVDAMAQFTPPLVGETTLPDNYQTALNGVIASSWS